MRRERRLPLSWWLAFGLTTTLVAPVAVVIGLTHLVPSWATTPTDRLRQAGALLAAQSSYDQRTLAQLRRLRVEAVVVDKTRQRLLLVSANAPTLGAALFPPGTFTSAAPARDLNVSATRTIALPTQAGRVVATLWALSTDRAPFLGWVPELGGLLTLALILLLAWRFTRRTLGLPLAAVIDAASHVEHGQPAPAIPKSPIHEVAQLTSTFEEMSRSLAESGRQATRAEEDRQLFLTAIAHDLRTPLFALRARLDALIEGIAVDPEHIRRYALASRRQAERLQQLVENVFAYTRLEYLGHRPRREPITVRELLDQAIEDASTRAADADVRIENRSGPAQALLNCEPNLILRALDNLIDNALRSSHNGGRVEVGWRLEDDEIHIDINDHGGAPTQTPAPERAGVGLQIVRRITQAHDGRLTLNARGDGTLATLTLNNAALTLAETHTS